MGGEQELQARDVPAAGAQAQRPAAEPRPPAPAQRAPGARPDHTVGRQAAPSLEPLHGDDGRRTSDTIDAAGVEAARAQRDLEGGDIGGGRSRRGGRRGEHERGDR